MFFSVFFFFENFRKNFKKKLLEKKRSNHHHTLILYGWREGYHITKVSDDGVWMGSNFLGYPCQILTHPNTLQCAKNHLFSRKFLGIFWFFKNFPTWKKRPVFLQNKNFDNKMKNALRVLKSPSSLKKMWQNARNSSSACRKKYFFFSKT